MTNQTKIGGAQAFDNGMSRHACPFEPGTVEYQDWTDGWAQRRAMQEKEATDSANASPMSLKELTTVNPKESLG
ncbi:MAG: hypothetical protein EOO82_01360 [Oxalobacteraceae bacterium]|nr:MAG: hypothetical protein EOO82_01360 [Oxalobacteraceae bacterium]